jgi:hypothetical protein
VNDAGITNRLVYTTAEDKIDIYSIDICVLGIMFDKLCSGFPFAYSLIMITVVHISECTV